MLSLACYNDEKFYQETLPEAICCYLQTCLLLIFIPLIEYIMYTKSCSHSSWRINTEMQLADKYGVYGGITNLRAFAKPVNPTV